MIASTQSRRSLRLGAAHGTSRLLSGACADLGGTAPTGAPTTLSLSTRIAHSPPPEPPPPEPQEEGSAAKAPVPRGGEGSPWAASPSLRLLFPDGAPLAQPRLADAHLDYSASPSGSEDSGEASSGADTPEPRPTLPPPPPPTNFVPYIPYRSVIGQLGERGRMEAGAGRQGGRGAEEAVEEEEDRLDEVFSAYSQVLASRSRA
jgi:hypothetical protein